VTRRAAVVTSAVLLLSGVLAGCSNDIGGSGDQGFVSGTGIITSVAAGDRKAPARVSGTTLDGERVDLADYRGKVVVLNVWGSWCAPCRAEAPMLSKAATDLAPKGVVFLGIDSRDPSKDAARAFVRQFDVPYPSIYDQGGRTLLAFRGTLTPNSVPSTVVVDARGRVAGSVLGPVTRSTLDGLVEDAS
jgi:thiol-disulfide isomerase/thioredoxin